MNRGMKFRTEVSSNLTAVAKFALMHSGIVVTENFLPRKQEPAVMDSFIRGITYFASAAYSDSEQIADAIYSMRSLIPDNEFETIHAVLQNGEFREKNQSLVAAYDQYMSALKAAASIDTVGLIRKAMAEARPLSCTICSLKEYPLSPLEKALVNKLSANQAEQTLPEFLGKDVAPLQNIDYTESYGSSNEVEAIYNYIVSHNIPFDKCTVAVANTTQYAQLFYDFAQSHNLSISLGCGVPILDGNPAKLLKLLYDWNTTGYNGVDALNKVLKSDALDQKKLFAALGIERTWQLDKVISMAGQLRLGFDQASNNKKLLVYREVLEPGSKDAQTLDFVTALAEEFALGESKLIEKYSVIRDGATGRVDRSALSVICDALDAYAKYAGGSSLNQIIPEILHKSVCSENSREGSLLVTGIAGATASMREHLFVAGLSAANFPGTPRENYLLLDSDYLLLGDAGTVPTSANAVAQKKEALENLLSLAAALDVQTHISYSGYDLAALKEENPSSVLFDIFKKQHGEDVTLSQFHDAIKHIGYFEQTVSADYAVGRAFMQGKEILCQSPEDTAVACAYRKETAFSPTAIDDFFNCPRHFFLTKILGVQEPEADDPFTVIDPAATGSLVHGLMEELAHNPCGRNTFLQKADAAFGKFLLSRPPIHADSAAAEQKIFRQIMENAYDSDPKNQVLASEEDQHFLHSSGVLLRGIPDRVEKTAEGEYIIADYKTGKRIKHVPHDIDTCLQVVIYAYLLEQKGIPISRCEYRYLRDDRVIPCRYDSTMKEKLNDKLLAFKSALDTGVFPATGNCTYCKLKNICGKENEEDAQ